MPDEQLYLVRQTLLQLLEPLQQAARLDDLRDAGVRLRHALRDAQHPLHAIGPEPEPVVFGTAYLHAAIDQIMAALTIDRAHYYVDRLIKSITAVRRGPLNDLNLNRWKEYPDLLTDSLWIIDQRDSSGVHSASYWGNFIPQIPNQLMRRYTRQGDWVLDPFAGSGTTLIEGQRLGRHTLGIELQPAMVEQTRKLLAAEPNPYGTVVEVLQGDSTSFDYRAMLARYGQTSVQLVILHPPYHDIIKFSSDPQDLSNAPSVEDFLTMIGAIIDNVAAVLAQGRYLAIVIGDKYARGDWIPLGFQTMNEAMRRGFALKSIIVKNFEQTFGKRSRKELWRYRALVGGFYIFKHEYIFLLRKQ